MDRTRWLSPEEQHAWRCYVVFSRLLLESLDMELQRDAGMPFAYYEILVRLSEAPDRTLRMSALAMSSRQSRSRLSHAVARLEDSGWVRRQGCPTDRRGALAHLTDEGFRALEAAAPGHVSAVRELLFDRLSAGQVRSLEDIATAVLTGLHVDGRGLPVPGCPDSAAEQEHAG
jgi:DNA-binding MarR family transcriptional regulator